MGPHWNAKVEPNHGKVQKMERSSEAGSVARHLFYNFFRITIHTVEPWVVWVLHTERDGGCTKCITHHYERGTTAPHGLGIQSLHPRFHTWCPKLRRGFIDVHRAKKQK